MSTMIIRPYKHGDEKWVKEVHNASVRSLGTHYLPAQLEAWSPEKATLKSWHESFRCNLVLVAVEDLELVGFGDITPDGYLYRLYVKPGRMGKGIGASLLKALEQKAREAGMDELVLDSSIPAVGFYKKHGYRQVEEHRIMIGDAVLDAVRMEKTLEGKDRVA